MILDNKPQVTHVGILDMQVCVPADWTDEQALSFAEHQYPCGTTAGWQIRREAHELLTGSHKRVECNRRSGFVHITLDA